MKESSLMKNIMAKGSSFLQIDLSIREAGIWVCSQAMVNMIGQIKIVMKENSKMERRTAKANSNGMILVTIMVIGSKMLWKAKGSSFGPMAGLVKAHGKTT